MIDDLVSVTDGQNPQPVRRVPFPGPLAPEGRTIGEEERAALERVLASGVLSGLLGKEASLFEQEVADLYGVKGAVACSSGTAALHVALAATGPVRGAEVITSPITDFGTIVAILAVGAIPVFADVDGDTGTLDPAAVEARISERTHAILVVHLFGQPADVVGLRRIADRYGIGLIEDCAQAWLAEDEHGGLVGTKGEFGCFSLQQYKHITAGEGGVVVGARGELLDRARRFVDKGCARGAGQRELLEFGLNYRMTDLQAGVAREQLRKLPSVVAERRRLGERLVTGLMNLQSVRPLARVGIGLHAWWKAPLVVDGDRESWVRLLAAEGVPVDGGGYLDKPLYLQPLLVAGTSRSEQAGQHGELPSEFRASHRPGWCPTAEQMLMQDLLVLPWNEGYSDSDVDDVIEAVTKVADVVDLQSASATSV